MLGTCRRHLEAVGSSRAALEIDPNNWPAWEELGTSLWALREFHDAEHALREALRLRPGLSSATVNLARLLQLRGRLEQAEEVCDQALAIDPRNDRVQRARSELKALREQQGQAKSLAAALAGFFAVLVVGANFGARGSPWLVLVALAVACAIGVSLEWSRKTTPRVPDPKPGPEGE